MKTQSTNGEILVFFVHTGMSGYLPNDSQHFFTEEEAISYMWDLFLEEDEILDAWDDERGDIVEIQYNEYEFSYIESNWLDADEIAELEGMF